jgi:DNA modification methylase
VTPAAVLAGEARWCVVHGDCLNVLPGLSDKSVDHVIADPPYEAVAHTKQRRLKRGDGLAVVELSFPPITEDERRTSAREIARIARRWSLVFCQVEATTRWAQSIEAGGHVYKRTCIWYKPDGQPQLTGDRPGTGYESIVVSHSPGRSRWNAGGRLGVFVHSARWSGGRPHDHPTEKPLTLMLDLVESFTDANDVIVDPYCGSGTTGVAALRLGRRFIGIEKDADFAQIARTRIVAESEGSTLQAVQVGQAALFGTGKP